MCATHTVLKNVELCAISEIPKYEALHVDQRGWQKLLNCEA